MTDILENSLVMVALTVFILIPIFIVKRNSEKKKQVLLRAKLEEIASDNKFKLIQKDQAGNLFIAYSDSRKLLLLNLVDFNHELLDLEKLKTAKEELSYNRKEVKSIKLVLTFNNGINREISIYKQFDDSERALPKAKTLATRWVALLTAST